MRQVKSDFKSDELKALKEISRPEHTMIDGRRLTIAVMDKSVLMIFADYPVLDTSLPYIPIYTHLKLRPLEIIQTPKLPALLHEQKELT